MSNKSEKTLILYATKHGAAREIARRISEKIDGAETCDLKQNAIPDLSEYDCVIFGSSIYAGTMRKEARMFLSQNADVLNSKRLGLFISGMDKNNEKEVLSSALPKELTHSAKAVSFLGGIFDPQKAGFFGRLIMKAATKQSKYTDTIDDEKISEFVKAVMIR